MRLIVYIKRARIVFRIAMAATAAMCVSSAYAQGSPCLNNVCIGQALADLPPDIWTPLLDLKAISRNPVYLASFGKPFFDDVAKRDADAQAFMLSAATLQFDGTVVRWARNRRAKDANGYCASAVTLKGEFKDANGRRVLVSVSGAQPVGKPSGLYVSSIEKIFGRDLDGKRFESEVRKTWPDGCVLKARMETAAWRACTNAPSPPTSSARPSAKPP